MLLAVKIDLNGSLTYHNGNLGCACAHVFQKRLWGALIGAGVLNRASMVYPFALLENIFSNFYY